MKYRLLIALFLLVAILVASLVHTIGLPQKYLISPVPYFSRMKYVFSSIPFESQSLSSFTDSSSSYHSLWASTFVWQPITVDGITDIPPAIKLAFDNIGGFLADFFNNVRDFFPKLWENIMVLLNKLLAPVKCVCVNAFNFIQAIFGTRDWLVSLKWAMLPIDWQTYRLDILRGIVPDATVYKVKVSTKDFDYMFGTEWSDILTDYAEAHRGGK